MHLNEITDTNLVKNVWDTWVRENPDLTDPVRVNNGYCFEFALDVFAANPSVSFVLNTTPSQEHVVVVYNNKFYDAECLHGAPNLRALPIWQRMADLMHTSVAKILSNCYPADVRELCRVFDIQYPPTRE